MNRLNLSAFVCSIVCVDIFRQILRAVPYDFVLDSPHHHDPVHPGFRIDGIKQADRDPDKNFKTVRTEQEVAYVLRKHIDYREETRFIIILTVLILLNYTILKKYCSVAISSHGP